MCVHCAPDSIVSVEQKGCSCVSMVDAFTFDQKLQSEYNYCIFDSRDCELDVRSISLVANAHTTTSVKQHAKVCRRAWGTRSPVNYSCPLLSHTIPV